MLEQHPFSFPKPAKVRVPTLSSSCTHELTLLPLVFISEITARAYLVAEQHKRRTLAKADVARALSKSDQFDFLIDIVPREEGTKRSTRGGMSRNEAKPAMAGESSTAGEANASRAPIIADPGQSEGLIGEVSYLWTFRDCD
jgi:hypothetical protein